MRALSPETAPASKVRVAEHAAAALAVDVDALESRVLAWVSSVLEVKHKEARQQVGAIVRSEVESFKKQVAGLSEEQRRMSERMVQMQIGIGKSTSARKADIAEVRAQLAAFVEIVRGPPDSAASSGAPPITQPWPQL